MDERTSSIPRTLYGPSRRKARDFAEFWPLYLGEHSRPLTRRIHVAGTLFGVILIVGGIVITPMLALLGVAVGYGFAWLAHFFVERNHPATFGHPWWSLMGDLKMTMLFVTGRLDGEVRRHRSDSS
jgi:hypothetical protein